MESRYMVLMNLFKRQEKTYRDIENRLMGTAGRGEGGMNSESSIETYITICETESEGEVAV